MNEPDDSAWAERAAILEYDAGLTREEAELVASLYHEKPETQENRQDDNIT